MNERIVIITGATALAPHVVDRIPESAIVLAVDGGLDHALAAGLEPSGVIGDLDSISTEGMAWAREHATISRHPTAKDRTDTELALSFAAAMMPSAITLVGGGDRLDHTVAALGALGMPELTSVPAIDAWWDGQHVDVIHGPGETVLDLEPATTLSLLAMHGECRKVSISGVRWELDEATLGPVLGLGVSNEVNPIGTDTDQTSTHVRIRLSHGVITVFDQPATSAPDDQQARGA